MQKKKDNLDNLIDKIVRKDYNNELEKVLEKKAFAENTKSILLNILYKIETTYKDYKKVKQNVKTKENLIEDIINSIKNNCEDIKLIAPNSEESKMLGNKTFLVEKNKKRIISYNVERKVLYCISKIAKSQKIIKDKYFLINETLSNLINTGNSINTVEPLRDFNGYSWTTIPREIESIDHNIIYQNLILLLGNDFIEKWVKNKDVMIDYMEKFQNKMETTYGKELSNEFIETLKEISILLEIKYNKESMKRYDILKKDLEDKYLKMQDNKEFVENITKEKKVLTNKIKEIDETINNKKMLQKEYEIRNNKLPLEEKIFSMRILMQVMAQERNEKIEELNKLNELLKPNKYIKIKKEIEEKLKILVILDKEEKTKELAYLKLKLEKIFLQCFNKKIEGCNSKQEILKLIYEFRYYAMLPYSNEKSIYEEKALKQEIEKLEKNILEKAHKLKVLERLSKQEEFNYQLLKYIFENRSINLEETQVKLIREKTKEKTRYTIQVFDGNKTEESAELKDVERLDTKKLAIRFNKKVKIFC